MDERNFEYLKKQVTAVIGEGLEDELKKNLEGQQAEFKLMHSAKFGNDTASAELNFRKSDQSDRYYFNSYDVLLKPEQSPDLIQQTFYVNRDSTFTLEEGYNLMCGRTVNKDLERLEKVGEGEEARFQPTGEMYNSWVKLNYKETDRNGSYKIQHNKNYNYDLEAAVAKHPIKELTNVQEKAILIDALKKGNCPAVTFIKDGKEEKRFIEANPTYGSVKVYNAEMKEIKQSQTKERSVGKKIGQSQSKDKAVNQEKAAGKGKSGSVKRINDQSQGQGMSA